MVPDHPPSLDVLMMTARVNVAGLMVRLTDVGQSEGVLRGRKVFFFNQDKGLPGGGAQVGGRLD